MPDALTAIANLRHVVASLERSSDPVLVRHAHALRSYEEGAPAGYTLDEALGLAQRGGAGPWWLQEARMRRDDAIRQVRVGFLANLDPGDAVDEIARLAARRMASRSLPANDKERLVDEALRTGARFPGKQQLRKVIEATSYISIDV